MDVRNFIDGKFVPAANGRSFQNIGPATGEVIGSVPDSDATDVDAAVAAASDAYPKWSATPAEERAAILMRLAEIVRANAEELAQLESLDNGKAVSLARRMDIPRAVANFRFFAGAVLHWSTECYPTDRRALNYTLRTPIGVAGLISPWNLPLYLLTWKIAPALASGNTCVAKPSELTPLTAQRLAELSLEAGLPPGVMNIVHGYGSKAGEAITSHPRVPLISFTGGTVTGGAVMRAAGPMFKKISLELGGKNPNLIFADADMDEAVKVTLQSSFANQGEICLCGSRIFVERSAYRSFLERFSAAASAMKIGDPREDSTEIGALITRQHLDKVRGYIELAREEGGSIVCGGEVPEMPERLRDGFYLRPTVLTDLDPSCRTMQEEIFGPVVTVTPFDTSEQAVSMANCTRYGLSASVWTRDLDRAHAVARALDAGTVWVNTWLLRDLRVPFGGVKDSGVGREGGHHSLEFFTEPKTICVKLSEVM